MTIRIMSPQRHLLVLTDLTCQLICRLENSRAKAHSVFKCFVSLGSSSSYVSNVRVYSPSLIICTICIYYATWALSFEDAGKQCRANECHYSLFIDSPNCVTKFAPNFFLVRDGSSASKSPRDHAFPTRDIQLGPS